MTPRARSPTVECVKLPADLPMRRLPIGDGRPPILRLWGIFALAVIFASIFSARPHPGLSGDAAAVTAGLVLLAVGVALSMPRRALPPGQRLLGLALVGLASVVLYVSQPHGAG